MGAALDIMNKIRSDASPDYQNRIPEATRQTLINIGQAFQTYTEQFNEFVSIFFNKIGKETIEQKMFENRLARFKGEALLSQKDIAEYFVNPDKAEGNYDPDGTNPLGRRNPPDVKVAYHRQNRQYYFAKSLGDIDFLQVFQNETTLTNWMSSIINSMYAGDNLDEWYSMKNVLATYSYKDAEGTSHSYYEVEVPVINETNTEESCKRFVKTLRKAARDLTFPSDKYNAAGVMTQSEMQNLVLFLHKDVEAEVDVEVLAKAFNMGKTDIQVEVVVLDDFGSLSDTYGILVDEGFFKVHDTLYKFEPQRNAQGLFTNWFFHHHQILSASPFKNAVRLKAVTA